MLGHFHQNDRWSTKPKIDVGASVLILDCRKRNINKIKKKCKKNCNILKVALYSIFCLAFMFNGGSCST